MAAHQRAGRMTVMTLYLGRQGPPPPSVPLPRTEALCTTGSSRLPPGATAAWQTPPMSARIGEGCSAGCRAVGLGAHGRELSRGCHRLGAATGGGLLRLRCPRPGRVGRVAAVQALQRAFHARQSARWPLRCGEGPGARTSRQRSLARRRSPQVHYGNPWTPSGPTGVIIGGRDGGACRPPSRAPSLVAAALVLRRDLADLRLRRQAHEA